MALHTHRLQAFLTDEFYHVPLGSTDSEWAFALYLQLLSEALPHTNLRTTPSFSFAVLRDTMSRLIKQLNLWAKEAGVTEPSLLNFAISDGYSVVCSRYISSKTQEAASLVRTAWSLLLCPLGSALPMLMSSVAAHTVLFHWLKL